MIHYKTQKKENRFWIMEHCFSDQFELKTESIFSQCNGYMGVRAVQPFTTIKEEKGMFLSGFFNKAYKDEVTELVNCPDITWFELQVNGVDIYPDKTKLNYFCRKLDVLSGELCITYEFEITDEVQFRVENRRVAAMQEEHLFLQNLKITPIRGKIEKVLVRTGIDGRMTNSGVSHVQNMDCRVYDNQLMEVWGRLEEGNICVLSGTKIEGARIKKRAYALKRRSIFESIEIEPDGQKEIMIEKIAYISCAGSLSRDSQKELLYGALADGYSMLFEKHRKALTSFWNCASIYIDGITEEEEACLYFAQYHLMGMTPWNTNECSIAAKGLTGEGYKGHVFWDTELFVFPFLLFTAPKAAKHLLEYRYQGLNHARKKAIEHNFRGAMFPWEAALTGEEETPLYANLNIHTGKANKVWSGVKEYHVTADIIYAVNQYVEVTGDQEFMEQCGYEMVFEAAEFWVSCAKWDEKTGVCGILDVIGPDEYTEHVDNNAYTNYMASYCVTLACECYTTLLEKEKRVFERLEQCLSLNKRICNWRKFLDHIYLPQPNQDGIIPQDDTFLSKARMKDIKKYKQSQKKQLVLTDYSRDEVVNMQVLKQADVVMLLNLFPKMWSRELVKKNVIFYEERTIHDSSLSYCAHAQACASIGEMESAEQFFKECLTVDLNDNPFDSTDGIHSASLGGIWNCLILGFAGIAVDHGKLYLNPHLPEAWNHMEFILTIQRAELSFKMSHSEIVIQSKAPMEQSMTVHVQGKDYTLMNCIQIKVAE